MYNIPANETSHIFLSHLHMGNSQDRTSYQVVLTLSSAQIPPEFDLIPPPTFTDICGITIPPTRSLNIHTYRCPLTHIHAAAALLQARTLSSRAYDHLRLTRVLYKTIVLNVASLEDEESTMRSDWWREWLLRRIIDEQEIFKMAAANRLELEKECEMMTRRFLYWEERYLVLEGPRDGSEEEEGGEEDIEEGMDQEDEVEEEDDLEGEDADDEDRDGNDADDEGSDEDQEEEVSHRVVQNEYARRSWPLNPVVERCQCSKCHRFYAPWDLGYSDDEED
ncbi:hypothetical protein DFH27DRAFT_385613 [Peziza echinospora]|nr:hypothetical protein DFH27DRAFT_385613 [Peziza echinospora]